MRLLPAPAARRAVLALAALVLVPVAATGCAAPGGPTAAGPSTRAGTGSIGAAAASSPAAELQAGLTGLLVERTYLVAATTDAVAAAGGELAAPGSRAALAALDAASIALADVLGATYTGARQPLLDALRRDDRLLARHAVALALRDAPAGRRARLELAAAQTELARTLRRVVPALDAPELAARVGADVQAQLALPSYERLRAAAQQAAGTARLLAAGIARDRDLDRPGDAARLRAQLTALLTEHAALVCAQARELRTPGARSQSARVALRANGGELAEVVGAAYPSAGAPFLRSWSAHLDRLEQYATARADGRLPSDGPVSGYPDELGRLLAEHVEELPVQSSRTELERALRALLSAVDAAAADRSDAPVALRQAAARSLPTAALVSAAMADDLRLS